ncbi:MAG: oxygen-dependent coproporphyrinogen oxidase [Bacteroidia bacterium]|nr:oxygen-dependent coproporphyrinogen oxidase [Bacteroidia bacterium]
MDISKRSISDWFKSLQNDICRGLEELDGKEKFSIDEWQRDEGGGGVSTIIQNGSLFEKGGVNFSAVSGILSAPALKSLKLDSLLDESSKSEFDFFATGISIVIHPLSPMVPIIHMNLRYFELEENIKWFGGGIDLTPIYIVERDAAFFHQELKHICDKHDPDYHKSFKNWADDYFFIKHRNENRGIGGIFFDRLSQSDNKSLEDIFEFVKDVGNGFIPIYSTIVINNKATLFNEDHKNFQALRRSRYVEFNLMYDRGTKFGLETNGRVESILMSMPPVAQWEYNYQPIPNSAEAKTFELLKKGIDWHNIP